MKRLNTEAEIAPIVAQFVPVKLDIDSDEYRQWRQDYASEGNTIPKLFVVRADGETLYGKSGSLSGDALPEMLVQALRHSGRILTAQEAQRLVAVSDRFEESKNEGDLPGAIKALTKLKRLGLPGEIGSYAEPAMRLNKLVLETVGEGAARLNELKSDIQSDDVARKLDAVLGFLEVKRLYGGLKLLKPEIVKFQKEFVSVKENRQLVREAKTIAGAKFAKTKSTQSRAVAKLGELIATTEIDPVKTAAEKALAKLKQDLAARLKRSKK